MRSYRFDGFELSDELRRDGDVIHLERKPRAVLCLLAESSDRYLSSDEIRQAVWSSTYVTMASVHNAISEVRRALAPHTSISGKQGLGYRLLADVERLGHAKGRGSRAAWRRYACAVGGSAEHRIAEATKLVNAECDLYD